jgi:hypothetical protein
MAYSPPPRWEHGLRNASAARFNVYSADIVYLYPLLDGIYPALYPMGTGEECQFLNLFRWLWYQTRTGEVSSIKDPSGTQPDVTLPSNESGLIAFDLATVSWLTPGQWYRVTGCAFAMEDSEP